MSFCQARVDRWVEEVSGVSDIDQLEALVKGRLQMVFEDVLSDADFDRLKDAYAVVRREFVFASLPMRFDDATFGMLIRREHVPLDAPDRYVAVIDCRGMKAARRFFTRWHEIAHRLTACGDDVEPRYRSAKDPIERLMDEIAGRVGFYRAFMLPAFQQAMAGRARLTFDVAGTVIDLAFPAASFQATLCACARIAESPVVYMEAAIAYKAVVQRRVSNPTPSMFGDDEPPSGQLRAVTVVGNTAAQKVRFDVPTNMRVPASSVISRCFEGGAGETFSGHENLCSWEDSKGKRLADCEVAVEARRLIDRVIAVVQPIYCSRALPACPAPLPLFGGDLDWRPG